MCVCARARARVLLSILFFFVALVYWLDGVECEYLLASPASGHRWGPIKAVTNWFYPICWSDLKWMHNDPLGLLKFTEDSNVCFQHICSHWCWCCSLGPQENRKIFNSVYHKLLKSHNMLSCHRHCVSFSYEDKDSNKETMWWNSQKNTASSISPWKYTVCPIVHKIAYTLWTLSLVSLLTKTHGEESSRTSKYACLNIRLLIKVVLIRWVKITLSY